MYLLIYLSIFLSIYVSKRTTNNQSDEAYTAKIYCKIRVSEVRSCTIYKTCILLSIYVSIFLSIYLGNKCAQCPLLCMYTGGGLESTIYILIYLSIYLATPKILLRRILGYQQQQQQHLSINLYTYLSIYLGNVWAQKRFWQCPLLPTCESG